MARKTDEEKLQELEQKMEQIKARKQQVEARLKEKERKARTKRLIEVGAIFEKYFEIEGQEEAEKIAKSLQAYVSKHKEKMLNAKLGEAEINKASKEVASTKEV